MKHKYLLISYILVIAATYITLRMGGCCFKNHQFPEVDSFDMTAINERIRADSLIIATLTHENDSLDSVKQKTITIVKHEVKRVKTHNEVIDYIRAELEDTTSINIVVVERDSFYMIKAKYGQELYNVFYERIAYKELYRISEKQLLLMDSMFVTCSMSADSLYNAILHLGKDYNTLKANYDALKIIIDEKDRKIKNRNLIIIGDKIIIGFLGWLLIR